MSCFDVQEARMSRVHGCTRATLGTSFLDKQKRSTSPLKAKPIVNKSNSSYFILDSRFHGNDGGLLDSRSYGDDGALLDTGSSPV